MSSVVTLVTRSSGDLREVSTLVSGLIRPLRPITREHFALTDSGLVEIEPDVPVDPALRAKPVMDAAAALEPTQLVPVPVPPKPTVPRASRLPRTATRQVVVGDPPADASAFCDVTVRRAAPATPPRSSLHQVPLPDRRPTIAEDLLGVTLAGYTLTDLVGSRNEEWTYEGRQQHTNASVVVKVLPPPARPRRVTAELCRRTMAVKRLDHRNIVRVMDLVEDADKLSFIVLERPAGVPLRAKLARRRRLMPRRAVSICLQICDALAAAHAVGLTPAELNLDSIFLARGQLRDEVKIHDLGLRTPDASPSADRPDPMTGSAWFRSPEERTGATPTAASNIYSVGALLCYMLGGHADSNVPPALAEIVIRCMSANPAQRFPTMLAVRAALERATGEAEQTHEIRREERRRERTHKRLSLGVALLALVLALSALTGVVLLSRGATFSAVTGQAASIKSQPAVVESVNRGPVVESLEALK